METQTMSNQNIAGNVGENKKKVFLGKVKEHKKEIVIGAATVLLVVAVVVVAKNRAAIISAIKSSHIEEVVTKSIETRNITSFLIPEPVSKSVTSKLPIDHILNVREHIRNLPEGWHPSISKVKLAAKYGYSLGKNQTLVNAYKKVYA